MGRSYLFSWYESCTVRARIVSYTKTESPAAGFPSTAQPPNFSTMTPQEDYNHFLAKVGMTEADVQRIMAEQPPLDPSHHSYLSARFYIWPSPIQGLGVFVTPTKDGPIQDQGVFVAADTDGRTILARYVNHSSRPNCEIVPEGETVYIRALRQIEVNEELTLDYLDNMRKQGFRTEQLDLPGC